MFAKLLKHEWKATRGLLGIFSLAALIAGAVGAVALRFITGYAEQMMSYVDGQQAPEVEAVAVSGLVILLAFVVLALIVYFLGTQIVLLYRFYRNKFTDEGYLTFTLPAKTHQILGASWLNMLIWMLISGLVFLAAMTMMIFGALEGLSFLETDVSNEIMSFYTDFSGFNGKIAALSAISSLLEWLVAPLIAMTCITIGAIGAKKHKILLAIAVYYGYSMLSGIVSTVVMSVVTIANYQVGSQLISDLPLICGILAQSLMGIICWFLMNYLINSKLNLP